MHISLSRRSDPDKVPLWIRPGRKIPDAEPQHWLEWLGTQHYTVSYARIDIFRGLKNPETWVERLQIVPTFLIQLLGIRLTQVCHNTCNKFCAQFEKLTILYLVLIV
jgi:hypothetical protein